ncbi:hypothetical protein [Kribbella sp. NPDC004875]|uniref:hypothetical protein n=1 Tax=Kribbella sp. NPDC004875 TaxID=3364107 RepID=UPI0036A4572D
MIALLAAPTVRLVKPAPADLVRTVDLAPGVTAEIDLADPSAWHAVEVRRWADADRDLLETILGAPAVREVDRLLAAGAATGDVPVDCGGAGAWLRLAVVEALDWWLQVPLRQGLLDAERAIVLAQAARTLAGGELRRTLVDRAIVLARRSAGEVVSCLNDLADRSLPRALGAGLSRLTVGYAALAREVDGPDAALAAVQTAWERLRAAVPVGGFTVPSQAPLPVPDGVDPRQLRARIAGSGVRLIGAERGAAVRVVVPAYAPRPSAVVADRLLVRLVDRRSGETQEPVLLTLRSDTDEPVFTEVVPLRGASVEHLRADVFDADSDTAPARSDGEVLRLRRAQLVLSEWRRAVAESRLARSSRPRKQRLNRLLQAFGPGAEPLFSGGPAPLDIAQFLEGTATHPWFASTSAAGSLLTAELAVGQCRDKKR